MPNATVCRENETLYSTLLSAVFFLFLVTTFRERFFFFS